MSESESPPPLSSRKAPPTAAEWHKFEREQRRETPARIEDAAKFLAGMISISLTIFVRFDAEAFADWRGEVYIPVAVFLWLLSLLAAFLVLFPAPYRYHRESAADIERMLGRIITYKYAWLIASAVSFLLALGIVAGVYLRGAG